MKYDDEIMDRWPQSEDTPTELKIWMFGVVSKMKDLFRIFRKCGDCVAFDEIDDKAKALCERLLDADKTADELSQYCSDAIMKVKIDAYYKKRDALAYCIHEDDFSVSEKFVFPLHPFTGVRETIATRFEELIDCVKLPNADRSLYGKELDKRIMHAVWSTVRDSLPPNSVLREKGLYREFTVDFSKFDDEDKLHLSIPESAKITVAL